MSNDRSFPLPERVNGKFPAFTSYGSEPILYYNEKSDCFCADCASKDDLENPPTMADVYYEGEAQMCEECGKPLESAYGPVE